MVDAPGATRGAGGAGGSAILIRNNLQVYFVSLSGAGAERAHNNQQAASYRLLLLLFVVDCELLLLATFNLRVVKEY